jgi:hypothetical protein
VEAVKVVRAVMFCHCWAHPVVAVESPQFLQHGKKEGKLRNGLLEGNP